MANVQIDMLEAIFRQKSDSSYKAVVRVKNLLLDDLRECHKPGSVTRMIDRYFNVDPDAFMLIASFDFIPKNPANAKAAARLREFDAKNESEKKSSPLTSECSIGESLHLHQFGLSDDLARLLRLRSLAQ